MPAVEISVAAAVAVLDYNMLGNSPHRTAQYRRRLKAIALSGSAAAGDSAVSVSVNQTEVARVYCSATGFPTRDHLKSINVDVPANAEVAVIVVDAPATNPLNVLLEF